MFHLVMFNKYAKTNGHEDTGPSPPEIESDLLNSKLQAVGDRMC